MSDPTTRRRRVLAHLFAIGGSVVTTGLLAIMGTSTTTLGMVLVLVLRY